MERAKRGAVAAKSEAEPDWSWGLATLEGQPPRSCRSLLCLPDSLALQVLRGLEGGRQGPWREPPRPCPLHTAGSLPRMGSLLLGMELEVGEVRGGKHRE